MTIYIDFDGTLYNTNKLYKNFINVFKKYNIQEQQIKELMREIPYKTNKSFDILADNIINKYNLDKEIFKELDKLYDNNYIYTDTISFLEKYYQQYNLILLTLGNISYQQKKINSTNIKKYFKDIIITDKDKSKLNIDYSKGIFIDNNPKELERFYNSKAIHLIRIKRNDDKYSKLKLNIKDIPEFKDFNELLNNNYIEKIGDDIYE